MIFASARSFVRNRDYRYLLLSTFFVLLIGIFAFKYFENWAWIDCVNYAVSTMVTTGNASVYPVTEAGKIFNVFYMFVSVILILLFVNTVTEHFRNLRHSEEVKDKRHKQIVKNHIQNLNDSDS